MTDQYISMSTWTKITWSTLNSLRSRLKHASRDLPAKPGGILVKMFATGEDRCPVAIFKEFFWLRPLVLSTTGPLYLFCVKAPSSQVWYKQQPMGVNKIDQMMKSIIKHT